MPGISTQGIGDRSGGNEAGSEGATEGNDGTTVGSGRLGARLEVGGGESPSGDVGRGVRLATGRAVTDAEGLMEGVRYIAVLASRYRLKLTDTAPIAPISRRIGLTVSSMLHDNSLNTDAASTSVKTAIPSTR